MGCNLYAPLKTRTQTEVIQAYIDEVYAKFQDPPEFKNQLFTNLATQLVVEYKIYFSPHPSQ